MTPRETISDLTQSGIPYQEAVRIAREEFERQRATQKVSERNARDVPRKWRV